MKRSHKIPGLTVQDDLRWSQQFEDMVKNASKTSWVLRRTRALGVDQTTLVSYWKAEGRVHLEISCPVWHSSLTASQNQDLERAQRVAMAGLSESAGTQEQRSEAERILRGRKGNFFVLFFRKIQIVAIHAQLIL